MTIVCEVCGAPTLLLPIPGERLWRCVDCGHVHRPEPGDSARHHAYGGLATRDETRMRLTYRRIRKAMAGRRVDTVFDVGFGDGALLRQFLDDGAEIAGCDPGANETPVDPQVSRFGTLYATGVENVPAGDQADLVVAIHVVEHLPNALESLRLLTRLVRPGGTLFVTTPTADCLPLKFFGGSWWMLEDPTHVRFFSPTSITLGLRGLVDEIAVSRPVLDSIGSDGASLVRLLRRERVGELALADTTGRLLSAAAIPPTAAVRLLEQRSRPVLEVVARGACQDGSSARLLGGGKFDPATHDDPGDADSDVGWQT